MSLESDSTQGIVSTGGTKNGLHAESRVIRTLQEDISASASSQLTSYASVVNKGNANVLTSGAALSGSWDPTFVGTKVRSDKTAGNENVATSATGTLGTLDQMIETNGDSDAADVSSILQSAVVGACRGKMPLESNGVGINSRRVHAESVVSAFQHPTYTTEKRRNGLRLHVLLGLGSACIPQFLCLGKGHVCLTSSSE